MGEVSGSRLKCRWVLLCFAIAAGGCDRTAARPSPPASNLELESISIAGASVIVGFKAGTLRDSASLSGYRITRFPVSAREFAKCAAAGACSEAADAIPATANEQADEGNEPPAASPRDSAVAVSSEQSAASFCSWVGGKLPTLPQWLMAARGAAPRRFSWGDALPTCSQHPRGLNVPAPAATEVNPLVRARAARSYAGCGNSASQPFDLGQHPTGASPAGIEDVLITSSELVARDAKSIYGACRGSDGFCQVYGATAGAIDFVKPLDVVEGTDDVSAAAPRKTGKFGFRCVWNEEG